MAYSIKEVSRREQLDPDGVTINRVMDVSPYASRGEAYTDLLGGVKFLGGRIVRFPPLGDPAFPWARVNSITCDPIDTSDYLDGSVYGNSYSPLLLAAPYHGPARLNVAYRTPSLSGNDQLGPNEVDAIDASDGNQAEEQQEVELATLSWDFSTQNLTLPTLRYGFETHEAKGRALVDELLASTGVAATKAIPRLEISLERKFVVRKPTATILTMLGRINAAPFTVGFDTYPAETLRFDSAMVRQAITNQGVKFFNITYKFSCMPVWDTVYDADGNVTDFVGWNRLFNPRTALWERVRLVSDGTRGIHELDSIITGTYGNRTVSGFKLLFSPRAR